MITSKYFDLICIIFIIMALIFSLFLTGNHEKSIKNVEYENRLFDSSKVHNIDIIIDDWNSFISSAQNEEYFVCDIVIDGERFDYVGIRAKGNISLDAVASIGSSRYSFKLEFDQYIDGQNYYGLDKINLNNFVQDSTMMKDFIVYQMMNKFGVPSPLASYAYITINGKEFGLYLAVEAIEDSFLKRNYGSKYGKLYKPDNIEVTRPNDRFNSSSIIEDIFKNIGKSINKDESLLPLGARSPSDTKLQYIDENINSYKDIFDNAKTIVSEKDKLRLIKSIKTLNYGDAKEVVDVDSVIRYFVVHNFVVNGDSYTGELVHNYYLYEKDGKLSMIPWDYNLSFGMYGCGSATDAVNDNIDEPLYVTGTNRPMFDWILDNEVYIELYHNYFLQFIEKFDCTDIIEKTYYLILPYVEKDPTKFCTIMDFEKGVSSLAKFCFLREKSVKSQLSGNMNQIDASSVNLFDMYGMGLKNDNYPK